MASKKKIYVRIIGVALTTAVLSVGTVLFLLSPPGLRWMSPLLEGRLSRALGASVTLEGAAVRWPLELELTRLRVADGDTVYLEVSNSVIRVSARHLWRRHLWVHRLQIEKIAYNGWPPQNAEEPTPRETGPITVPDPVDWLDWITIESASIDSVTVGERVLPEAADFRVEADLTRAAETTTGRLTLTLTALGETTWAEMPPVAHAQATLTQPKPGHRRGVLAVEIADWGVLIPDWPVDLKDELSARGTILLENGRYVRLEESHVESPLADMDMTATWDAHAPHLLAQMNGVLPDVSRLSQWLETELEGSAGLRAAIEGDPSSPSLEAEVESERLRVGTQAASDIRVALKAANMTALTHGAIRAQAVLDEVPVEVSTEYAWDSSTLALQDIRASALNLQVEGDAEVDWAGRLVRGLLRLETDDMAELAALGGLDASGQIQAALHMTAESQRQDAELEVSVDGVTTPFGTMDALRIEAMLHDVFAQPHGMAEVRASHIAAKDLDVRDVHLSLAGDPQSIAVALTGAGNWVEPWTLSSSGLLQIAKRQPEALVLHDFTLRHGEFEVLLEETARLVRRQDRYAMDPLALHVGTGRLTVSGFAHSEEIAFEADLKDLSLSDFVFAGVSGDAQGIVGGQLQVSGHPSNPRAELQGQLSGLRPARTVSWDGPPAHFSLAAHLEDSRLSSRFLLKNLPGRPAELNLNIPLRASLYPFNFKWPPEGPVSGKFAAETDLAELAKLFVLDMHRLGGLLAVDMKLGGTLQNLDVSGQVRVTDGAYEHERTSTILRDVSVLITGQKDRLTIEHATATDGDRGRLSLSGALQLLPESDYPFAAELSLEDFRLLRHDIARATGHGTATWEGNRDASKVAGKMTVSTMDLRIPERLPAGLIDLEFVEINGDEKAEDQPDELRAELERHTVKLNLDVSFPARVFVRGRGLESEWGGEMQIRGSAREPLLTGSLSVLRGRFTFFGKRLTITHGLLTLTGVYPPTPLLDVVAESRSAGITAIMRLSGDLDAPAIELDSTPSMPEDEILSRLLFGRAAARITPWQAVTIAQAVNRLRGGGSAFDVMGATRRLLGVDRIEVLSDEENEGQTAVSVGKYVSDSVYVELERGAGVEGGRASVEVELTPTIRLETEMGAAADTGLNVIWSWGY